MSDRLTLSNAFEDAGIERIKAERLASTIFNAIHDNVATKVDVLMLRTDIEKLSDATKAEFGAVQLGADKMAAEMKAEHAAIRSDIGKLTIETKAEFGAVRLSADKLAAEMKAEHAAIRSDIGVVEMNLRGEIAAVRGEMRSEFAAVRGELRGDIAAVRGDMALLEQRMLVRLGGMMVVAVGVLLAAIRYLHP